MQRSLIMVTGPSSVGKSTFMDGLIGKFEGDGVLVRSSNDYHFYTQWSRDSNNKKWVEPVGDSSYNFLPGAYQQVSVFAAEKLADIAVRLYDMEFKTVIVEAARGALGEENYTDGLLIPLVTGINRRHEGVAFVNFEIEAPKEEIMRRAELRFEKVPTAPPVEVSLKYFNGDELHCSSVSEFENLSVGVELVMNETVSNKAGKEALLEYLDRELYPRLVERLGLPRVGVEGRPIGPEGK